MKATIEDLQAAIARERDYQDAKWGTPQDNPHSLAGWLLIAEGELDEAIEAWRRGKGDTEAKAELLQMVAVGCAWLEQSTGLPLRWFELPQRPPRHLEEALGVMKKRAFPRAWGHVEVFDEVAANRLFVGIIETGMAALLQHGIVERYELEAPQAKCPVCGKPSISGKRWCYKCRLAEMGLLS